MKVIVKFIVKLIVKLPFASSSMGILTQDLFIYKTPKGNTSVTFHYSLYDKSEHK